MEAQEGHLPSTQANVMEWSFGLRRFNRAPELLRLRTRDSFSDDRNWMVRINEYE